MLQHVTGDHFRALLGAQCALHLEDGSLLPVVIESIQDKALARLSETSRLPFSVAVNALVPSDFIDGPCTIDLPELGRLEGVFVSRVPPLGRDANLAYYCISFN
ncbi:MAG: DUF6916 family protein [Pseudomonas sp.]|uniref:DUF6916 family protein n=1 Tax=unclassified Pseudomonas TaxID=196821 RepID=UPI0007307AD0|nr:hypothetical protein [Pseudomonas sp. L5B5]KTC33783.1 hypothetical protein AO265_01140 [Pseudomonas sp. ABAC61]UCZ82335.1 hypothetical protein LGQ10_18375 [Pseudomonas sp. L5B5]